MKYLKKVAIFQPKNVPLKTESRKQFSSKLKNVNKVDWSNVINFEFEVKNSDSVYFRSQNSPFSEFSWKPWNLIYEPKKYRQIATVQCERPPPTPRRRGSGRQSQGLRGSHLR